MGAEDKDYSLLRPFDLEAAKAGAPIAHKENGEPRTFVTGPDKQDYFVVESEEGFYRFGRPTEYRMAPLCWVEGKPVYKGDPLYQHYGDSQQAKKRIADSVFENGHGKYLKFECGANWSIDGEASTITWTPPKVKREGWVNVCRGPLGPVVDMLYDSEERSNEFAPANRIATIRIEWEEPAGGAQ